MSSNSSFRLGICIALIALIPSLLQPVAGESLGLSPLGPNSCAAASDATLLDSEDTLYPAADWRIALPTSVVNTEPVIQAPTSLESAQHFDLTGTEIAGFLVSRPVTQTDAEAELTAVLTGIMAASAIQSAVIRYSGNPARGADTNAVSGAILHVDTGSTIDVTAVRDVLVPLLLGRSAGEVAISPPGWIGTLDSSFVLTLYILHRQTNGQVVFVGAVARYSQFEDPVMATGLQARDFAAAGNLASSGHGIGAVCDGPSVINTPPRSDIIWVVDESASMAAERNAIAAQADSIFAFAARTGLDFRMGVTDMNDTGPGGQPGIFATRQAGGSGDVWISPGESSQFAAGLIDPSGPDAGDGGSEHGLTQALAALNRHLPRDDGDPQMLRNNTKANVVLLTDEKADEVEDSGILSEGNVEPSMGEQAQIEQLVMPYSSEFNANGATAFLIAEPLPFDVLPCSGGGGEHAYGYYTLVSDTGGTANSVCSTGALADQVRSLLEDFAGRSAQTRLSVRPVTTSIVVTDNGNIVPRSRNQGWDYNGAGNTLLFFNMPYDDGNPLNLEISYQSFERDIFADGFEE